ncbi:MAG: DUF4260 domain-containing protein [Pseudomonadota bacterium]
MNTSALVTQSYQDFIPLRRVEGAAIGLAAALVFAQLSGNWWLFAGLLLLPDIAILGYLAGSRIGAQTYNALHNYVVPICLGLVGVVSELQPLTTISTIWVAHIGFDRALGYGLKQAAGFKHTHLSGMEAK